MSLPRGMKIPAFLCLLALVQLCSAGKIQELSDRLENGYRIGCFSFFGKSEEKIAWDLVKAASEEYYSLSEPKRVELTADMKMLLLADFALVPAHTLEYLVANEEHGRYFVKRLMKTYKNFRPAYVEGEQIGGHYGPRVVRSNKIRQIGLGRANGQLTIEDFLLAKKEMEGWSRRWHEIRNEEDIYGNLEELEMIWNMFNCAPFRIIINHINPLVNRSADPQELLETYREYLREEGFEIETPPPAPPAQEEPAPLPQRKDEELTVSPGNKEAL